MAAMIPWAGGDKPPADWDGKYAMDRRGIIGNYTHQADAWKRRDCDLPDDIIAYSSTDTDASERLAIAKLHELQKDDRLQIAPIAGSLVIEWAAQEIEALRKLLNKEQGRG